MTLDELDVEFDILFNNITSNKAPGLNALEKSIFLTEAQDLLVKEYYTDSIKGFEVNEEIAEYLQSLVRQKEYNVERDKVTLPNVSHITDDSYVLHKPEDLMFITYESAKIKDKCSDNADALVVPTTQDIFYKTYKNPFRGPYKNRVLRLLINNRIELVSKNTITKYKVRYLSNPEPIVLKGLSTCQVAPYNTYGDLGNNIKMPESFHRIILLRAVQLAKTAWT